MDRRGSRHRAQAALRTSVTALWLLLGVGAAQAVEGQVTGRLQSAYLFDEATTLSLGLEYLTPLGSDDGLLPAPGETSVSSVREWLFTGALGAGVAFPRESDDDTAFTLTGYTGVMWRTGWFVEQVGAVAYGNLNPGGGGPALRARIAIVDLMVGGLWIDDDFTGVAGLDLSLAFLGDLSR
jgi:hypothetical protein